MFYENYFMNFVDVVLIQRQMLNIIYLYEWFIYFLDNFRKYSFLQVRVYILNISDFLFVFFVKGLDCIYIFWGFEYNGGFVGDISVYRRYFYLQFRGRQG